MSSEKNKSIVGVDIKPCDPIEGVHIIQGDIVDRETRVAIWNALGMRQVDVILSDLWSDTLNDTDIDCLNQVLLNNHAIDFSLRILRPGGTLLMRSLRGAFEADH